MDAMQGFDALHSGLVNGMTAVRARMEDAAWRRDFHAMRGAYNALVDRFNDLAGRYNTAMKFLREARAMNDSYQREVLDLRRRLDARDRR